MNSWMIRKNPMKHHYQIKEILKAYVDDLD